MEVQVYGLEKKVFEALERGELPEAFMEEERILPPDSPATIAFQKKMDETSQRLLGKNYDPNVHQYRFMLSSMPGENAYVIPSAKPPLIVFHQDIIKNAPNFDELAATLGHEMVHKYLFDKLGHHNNSKAEEGVAADLWPVFALYHAGFVPDAMSESFSRIAFALPKSLREMVDPHPASVLRERLTSDVMMAMPGRNTEYTPVDEAWRKTVLSDHRKSYVERIINKKDFRQKPLAEQFRTLQPIIFREMGEEYNPYFASRPGELLGLLRSATEMLETRKREETRKKRHPSSETLDAIEAYNDFVDAAATGQDLMQPGWVRTQPIYKALVPRSQTMKGDNISPPVGRLRDLAWATDQFIHANNAGEAEHAARMVTGMIKRYAIYIDGKDELEQSGETTSLDVALWPHFMHPTKDVLDRWAKANQPMTMPWERHVQWAVERQSDDMIRTLQYMGITKDLRLNKLVPYDNDQRHIHLTPPRLPYYPYPLKFSATPPMWQQVTTPTPPDFSLLIDHLKRKKPTQREKLDDNKFGSEYKNMVFNENGQYIGPTYSEEAIRLYKLNKIEQRQNEALATADWNQLRTDPDAFVLHHSAALTPSCDFFLEKDESDKFAEEFLKQLDACNAENPEKFGPFIRHFFMGKNASSPFLSRAYPDVPVSIPEMVHINRNSSNFRKIYKDHIYSHYLARSPLFSDQEKLLALHACDPQESTDLILPQLSRTAKNVPELISDVRTTSATLEALDLRTFNPVMVLLSDHIRCSLGEFLDNENPVHADSTEQLQDLLATYLYLKALKIIDATFDPTLDRMQDVVSQYAHTLDIVSEGPEAANLVRLCNGFGLYSSDAELRTHHEAAAAELLNPKLHPEMTLADREKLARTYLFPGPLESGSLQETIQQLQPPEKWDTLQAAQMLNPKLRQAVVDTWIEAESLRLGRDDGTAAYQTKIEALMETMKPLKAPMRSVLLTRLADKIVAQESLSHFIEEYIKDKGIKNIPDQHLLPAGVEYLLLNAGTHQVSRQTTMDLLLKPLTAERVDRYIAKNDISLRNAVEYNFKNNSEAEIEDDTLTQTRFIKRARALVHSTYDNFWNSSFEVRDVFFDKIAFPLTNAKGQRNEVGPEHIQHVMHQALNLHRQKRDSLGEVNFYERVSHNIDQVKDWLKPETSTEKRQRLVLEEGLKVRPLFDQRLTVSGMMIAEPPFYKSNNPGLRPGKAISALLTPRGPAGGKMLQAIDSHPDTTEEMREDMGDSKSNFSPPTNFQVHHWIKDIYPRAAEIERYDGVLGTGSYAVTLGIRRSGLRTALSLTKPDAEKSAKQEFGYFNKTASQLAPKDSIFAPLPRLVRQAEHSSKIETDDVLNARQIKQAESLYNGTVVSVDGEDFVFYVAPLLEHGPGYKETLIIPGQHFNDIAKKSENPKYVKKLAKAILTVEMTHLLSGDAVDHDRHGAQARIEGNRIGLFDFGGMALHAPSEHQKALLASALSRTMRNYSVQNPLAKPKSIGDALSRAIQEISRNAPEADQDYLSGVQRGLLALTDYMKTLSKEEILSVMLTVVAQPTLDPVIHKEIEGSKLAALSGIGKQMQLAVREHRVQSGIVLYKDSEKSTEALRLAEEWARRQEDEEDGAANTRFSTPSHPRQPQIPGVSKNTLRIRYTRGHEIADSGSMSIF